MPAAPDPLAPAIESTAQGTRLRIKVVAGASRSAVVGMLGDRLKIAVAAPPEAGRANQAVLRLLAAALETTRSDVTLVAGQTRPEKTVAIKTLTAEQVRARLAR